MKKIYWYEMKSRPIGIGCQPKGFVDTDDSKGNYGIVAYNRKLTTSELLEYEMEPYSKSKGC